MSYWRRIANPAQATFSSTRSVFSTSGLGGSAPNISFAKMPSISARRAFQSAAVRTERPSANFSGFSSSYGATLDSS